MNHRRVRTAAFALSLTVLAAACTNAGTESNGNTVHPPGPGDVPEKVAVAGSALTSGVAIGHVRQPDEVGAFQIAKHPVTVAQFSACVAAGGCSPPQEKACLNLSGNSLLDRSTIGVAGVEALPATCVGVAQAKAYCAWVGGKLPVLPQFLLAARGTSVSVRRRPSGGGLSLA